MIERNVTLGGVRIHYVEDGPGDPHKDGGPGDPPILLIHGLGSGSAKFFPAIPHLASFRRTIALDLPGFGRSDAPVGSYTPAWQAGAVRAFCDATGIDRAVLVGNSYGGLVATWFAAAWAERVAAATLVAPAFPNDGPPSKGGMQFVAGSLPVLGPLAQRAYWRRDPAAVVAESLARNCVDPSRVDPGIVRLLEIDAARKARDPSARRASLAAQRAVLWAVTGQRERTWRVLSSLRVPTLLMWGAGDRVVPVHVGHATAARLPGAHLIVIEDCGHNPQMERPEHFADALVSFIRATEAAGALPVDVTGLPPAEVTGLLPSEATGRLPADAVGGHRADPNAGAALRDDPDAATHVRLSEYDLRWPLMFEEEAARVRAALDGMLARIEHVGSTAVPGLAAKPTIDIAVTVPSLERAPACIEALEAIGYEYEARYEREIPHRRYFRKGPIGARTFHLHLYEEGHPDIDDYLAFRDGLRSDPGAAREYEQLKHRLAQSMVRADYTEAKGPFIRSVIEDARADR